jgi:Fe-S-cluster-containing dehydrogenase component
MYGQSGRVAPRQIGDDGGGSAMQRRDFLKMAGASSVTLLAGVSRASDREGANAPDAHGVLVDATACIGCRKCEWGCNEANTLSASPREAFEDKGVLARRRRPTSDAYTVINAVPVPTEAAAPSYMKVQCMHCLQPACASACIVGALRKTAGGPVTYDAWKCIGCRYCMVACPFQIPAYEYANARDPEVRKCSFCAERLAEGRKPGCVEICPNEALTFGRRQELLALAHAKIARFPERYVDHVYGEHEVGGTSWLYLAGVPFDIAGLPALPDEPTTALTERIQHGVFKSFVPPVALYGLLALLMLSTRGGQGGR